ncbi:MAG: hypothetical protein AAF740_14925, partial [Bacteroidota bacterium]
LHKKQLMLDHNPLPEVIGNKSFLLYPDVTVEEAKFGKMNFFEVDELGTKQLQFTFSVHDASALYK